MDNTLVECVIEIEKEDYNKLIEKDIIDLKEVKLCSLTPKALLTKNNALDVMNYDYAKNDFFIVCLIKESDLIGGACAALIRDSYNNYNIEILTENQKIVTLENKASKETKKLKM